MTDSKKILDFAGQLVNQDTEFPTLEVLNNEGKIIDQAGYEAADLSSEELVQLMTEMVQSRVLNDRSTKLSKQGRLGFFAPTMGQEASQIASNFAFKPQDWIMPGYRDIPELIMRGWPIYKAFLWSRGHYEGNEFGDVRGWFPQIIIGAQYVEAAGIALGLKMNGEDAVAYAYTGDGGSSQGDTYEGMNFASAYKAPAVFFIQNNGYAISTPRPVQTAAQHLAAKGWAVGIPSISVDGMDAIAMYLAAKEARQWAVEGKGPVLIETLTNRFGPHSMSGDDPLRYRTQEDIDEWHKKDPLIRMRIFLEQQGLWSEEKEAAVIADYNEKIDQAVKEADNIHKQAVSDLIESTFEVPTYTQKEQIEKFRQEGN